MTGAYAKRTTGILPPQWLHDTAPGDAILSAENSGKPSGWSGLHPKLRWGSSQRSPDPPAGRRGLIALPSTPPLRLPFLALRSWPLFGVALPIKNPGHALVAMV